MAEVYILHFKKPYWKNCQHYVGYTKFTSEIRCAVHRGERKNGSHPSKLVQYALRHDNDFVIAHVVRDLEDWEARQLEKRIKRIGAKKLCRVCKAKS